jgi:hypothetical protein
MLKGSDVSRCDEGLSDLFKSAGNSGGAVAQSAGLAGLGRHYWAAWASRD